MEKLEQFNSTNLRELREELNGALSDLAEQLGIVIEIGNMRFSEHSVSIKLDANIQGQLKTTETNLERYTDYKVGDVLDMPNTRLSGKIVVKGYNPKARKYPLIVSNNGKSYKIRYNHSDPYSIVE
jgi:hypothetical protein